MEFAAARIAGLDLEAEPPQPFPEGAGIDPCGFCALTAPPQNFLRSLRKVGYVDKSSRKFVVLRENRLHRNGAELDPSPVARVCIFLAEEEFQKLLSQARTEAKRAGIKRTDLKSAIVKVRRRAK